MDSDSQHTVALESVVVNGLVFILGCVATNPVSITVPYFFHQ